MDEFNTPEPRTRDGDGNLPRLHFDDIKQRTSVTKADILQWVIVQRNSQNVKTTLKNILPISIDAIMKQGREITQVENIMVEIVGAFDQAARDIHDIAVEFAYDPTKDPTTNNLCLEIIEERLRDAMLQYMTEVDAAKIQKDPENNTSSKLGNLLRTCALINKIDETLEDREAYDQGRLSAMIEATLEELPAEQQASIRAIKDTLPKSSET